MGGLQNEFETDVNFTIEEFATSRVPKPGDNLFDMELQRLPNTIKRYNKYIVELKTIKEDLASLREKVNNRGFFKTGKVKAKLDSILTVKEVKALRSEIKACVSVLFNAILAKNFMQLDEYLTDYKSRTAPDVKDVKPG